MIPTMSTEAQKEGEIDETYEEHGDSGGNLRTCPSSWSPPLSQFPRKKCHAAVSSHFTVACVEFCFTRVPGRFHPSDCSRAPSELTPLSCARL